MTIIQERPPVRADNPFAPRAWWAVAMVPVGLAAGIVLSFLGDGEAPSIGGALIGVLSLIAPVTAVVFGALAARAGERSGRAALMVSAVLLVAVAGLLPLIEISLNAWLVSLGVAIAALAVAAWRLRE